MVSPSEGNEVRRKGRQGVGASRSTADPGEPPEGPWGGKGAPSYEPLEGNMPGTPRPDPCPRNDNGSRNSPGIALIWRSRPWRITSTSNGCSQPMAIHAGTGPSAWTDKPRTNTRSTWRPTSRTSSTAPNPARTWRRRCVECTSPRPARQRDSPAGDTDLSFILHLFATGLGIARTGSALPWAPLWS